jgi:hypothetical protein
MKTKLNTIEINFYNQHPNGVRPGWIPRYAYKRWAHPFEMNAFFAINWRDKELIIEWTRTKVRR